MNRIRQRVHISELHTWLLIIGKDVQPHSQQDKCKTKLKDAKMTKIRKITKSSG